LCSIRHDDPGVTKTREKPLLHRARRRMIQTGQWGMSPYRFCASISEICIRLLRVRHFSCQTCCIALQLQWYFTYHKMESDHRHSLRSCNGMHTRQSIPARVMVCASIKWPLHRFPLLKHLVALLISHGLHFRGIVFSVLTQMTLQGKVTKLRRPNGLLQLPNWGGTNATSA
jgi:hypothetical protein